MHNLTDDKNPPPLLQKLKNCICLDDLAKLFDFNSYNELSKFIYPSTRHLYRSFFISKKNGQLRIIDAPVKTLKKIQKKIAQELNVLYKPRKSTHGFIKNRNIVTNSIYHVNKKYVLNLDLENFFGSIHFGRVRNIFQSYPVNLPQDIATVLAHMCCHNGRLPQGAPTSPIISNMIAYRLDKQLQILALNNRCTYTRYADDITFSFSQTRRRLPKSIVKLTKDLQLNLGNELKLLIQENGFTINNNKTRISSKNNRQTVTGVIVNNRVNVPREYIRKTRSMLYSWKKFGLINSEIEYLNKYHDKNLLEKHHRNMTNNNGEFFKLVLNGRINYIKAIRGGDDLIYRKLAFKYTELIGKPNYNLIKTPLDKACESIFIIDNEIDNSQGTAFLLKDIGLITNEHTVDNIDDNLSECLTTYRYFDSDKKREVKFKKSCKKRDLAILNPTKDFNGIKRLEVGDDSKLGIGYKVTVIGFPQYSPGETPYINTGKIIQSKILYGQKIWLVDIPIIHGNSGGPVLNEKQEVIGIATIGSPIHDLSTKLHGFIPISTLLNYYSE